MQCGKMLHSTCDLLFYISLASSILFHFIIDSKAGLGNILEVQDSTVYDWAPCCGIKQQMLM